MAIKAPWGKTYPAPKNVENVMALVRSRDLESIRRKYFQTEEKIQRGYTDELADELDDLKLAIDLLMDGRDFWTMTATQRALSYGDFGVFQRWIKEEI